jgi:hypothetical protein
MRFGRSAVAAAVVLASLFAAGGSPARPLPTAKGCPLFPRTSQWNARVDRLPVLAGSAAMVRSIGADANMHADFGSGLWDGGPIGIPYVTVPRGQKGVPVSFDYADESDRGRYPIPASAPVEGGRGSDGDRHVIVVDRSRCRLFELFAAYPEGGGARWRAGSGAVWNLRSNRLRPRGWTSADAAGLPILPGLARYDEVRRGAIDHALRFTASETRRAFVYPARHFASSSDDAALPAMGQRFRLKRGFDVSRFPRQSRVVLRALKRYGMILADNGSSWYLSGAPNRGWDNDDLHSLQGVPGSAFEAVDTSGLPRPRR